MADRAGADLVKPMWTAMQAQRVRPLARSDGSRREGHRRTAATSSEARHRWRRGGDGESLTARIRERDTTAAWRAVADVRRDAREGQERWVEG